MLYLLTDIATEQTTAVTDAIVAILAIIAAMYLYTIRHAQKLKATIWIAVFILLAAAAILGAIAHGLKLPDAYQTFIWHPLYLSLGLLVSLFIVGTVYDVCGSLLAQKILPLMLILGIIFFTTTLIWSDSFLMFITYETVAMLLALIGYIWLAIRSQLKGAWWMVAGVLVTITAAGVQATAIHSFTFIWSFDHNGIYHLIQMLGILLLVSGLRKALRSQV